MQDRFKFRVWDYVEEKLVYFDHFITFLDEQTAMVIHSSQDHLFIRVDKHEPLQQCTGLKDKNGKLIYEGDIVKHDNNKIREVEWFQEFGAWDMGVLNSVVDQEVGPYQEENIEVIGNIYETPELMK